MNKPIKKRKSKKEKRMPLSYYMGEKL